MKELAQDNGPFMGLEIHGLREIEFVGDFIRNTVILQKKTIRDHLNMKVNLGTNRNILERVLIYVDFPRSTS